MTSPLHIQAKEERRRRREELTLLVVGDPLTDEGQSDGAGRVVPEVVADVPEMAVVVVEVTGERQTVLTRMVTGLPACPVWRPTCRIGRG